MNIKNDLTEPERARLRAICNFTPEEARVFELRTKSASIVEIQLALNMSEATVNRRLRGVKNKIAKVSAE